MSEPAQSPFRFLVTCEHAAPDIPSDCESQLRAFVSESETHRVFDVGARSIAEEIAQRAGCQLLMGEVTRLAIDLNRSLGHPIMFSDPIFQSDERLKAGLIQKYYLPFRTRTIEAVEKIHAAGELVVHISVHSFTKIYKGRTREVDVGLLFDDSRPREAEIGQEWLKALSALLPDNAVRENQPYHGREDGHVTALRRMYGEDRYLGFEIELSQALELDRDAESWAKMLSTTLKKALRSIKA